MQERITQLLSRVPGYDGYRTKENRRDEDKRVREATADQLVAIVNDLTRKNASLVADRNLTNVSRLERLVSQTRLLADRIRTATYGYGGIFTERSVDEFALDQLRQFDVAFQAEIAALQASSKAIVSGTPQPDEIDFSTFETELGRLATLFDGRTQVIDTARPTQDQQVLDLLNTAPPPEPSPLWEIGIGETFSVLGDNYQVDATVTVTDGDVGMTLARVSGDRSGQGEWFLGSNSPEFGSAQLSEVAPEAADTAGLRPARVTIRSSKGAEDEIAGQYRFTGGQGDTVNLTYAIGGETRAFTGRKIVDADIETFGAA